MHAQHDRHRGWNPFWAALGAALLVLVPLVGGTVLLSRAQLRSSLRQAAKSQSGVPIRLPKAADQCPRCWNHRELGGNANHAEVCKRCGDVLDQLA